MQNPFKISNFAGKFQSFSRGKWKIKELKFIELKKEAQKVDADHSTTHDNESTDEVPAT